MRVRSETVAEKAAPHLGRSIAFFEEAYGHDRVSTVMRRDVQGWQRSLVEQELAPFDGKQSSGLAGGFHELG